jgi:hypothetical protein
MDGAFAPPAAAPSATDRRHARGRREDDRTALEEQDVLGPSILDDTYYDYVNKSKLLE